MKLSWKIFFKYISGRSICIDIRGRCTAVNDIP